MIDTMVIFSTLNMIFMIYAGFKSSLILINITLLPLLMTYVTGKDINTYVLGTVKSGRV